MTSDRALGGLVGRTTTTIGDPGTLINLTLFKTSELPDTPSRFPLLTLSRRAINEHIWPLSVQRTPAHSQINRLYDSNP